MYPGPLLGEFLATNPPAQKVHQELQQKLRASDDVVHDVFSGVGQTGARPWLMMLSGPCSPLPGLTLHIASGLDTDAARRLREMHEKLGAVDAARRKECPALRPWECPGVKEREGFAE